ncbi:hypothetical protein [Stutzerimonas stutzeri]|nr:hypothetical protein [Stutzerimonas stutzeri]MCQ4318883.1 hypothetical protein [Stutzerimonas stutzeri]
MLPRISPIATVRREKHGLGKIGFESVTLIGLCFAGVAMVLGKSQLG